MQDTHPVPLFDVTSGGSWRQQNGHLFHSATALRWFFRHHKRELVERGAVVLHSDRWMAVEPTMTQAVLSIAARNAQHAVDSDGPR